MVSDEINEKLTSLLVSQARIEERQISMHKEIGRLTYHFDAMRARIRIVENQTADCRQFIAAARRAYWTLFASVASGVVAGIWFFV